MGEKVYKPRLKDGDHLVRSKENPDRVRGLARDENNQNPDIPEFDEFDLDDLKSDTDSKYEQKESEYELTPEQREWVEFIAEYLADLTIKMSAAAFRRVIKPWWDAKGRPWIQTKWNAVKERITKKKHPAEAAAAMPEPAQTTISDPAFADISLQIDQVFEKTYFDMDPKEVSEHMMRLFYHMLGLVNEIRIISNARIRNNCESDDMYLETVKSSERFLSEKVAGCMDRLLSDPRIQLDLNTSRELFALTGGGVRVNGEYAPVLPNRIEELFGEKADSNDNAT